MEDLVRWLNTQLDEDERIARAAASFSGVAVRAGERWRVSGSHSDDGGTYWSVTTASPDLDRIPAVEMVGGGMSGGGAHTEEVAAHIAVWDPARVLREIDAKRKLLAEWKLANAEGKYPDFMGGYSSGLDYAVQLAAAEYADRPGYDPEWAPRSQWGPPGQP